MSSPAEPLRARNSSSLEDSLSGGATGQYYRYVRRGIEPLLPPRATRVLDLGAGAGSTSAWLRTFYADARFIAIEGCAALEPELRRNVDEAYIVDLNGPLPEVGAPDLVIALDILEHLADPWDVLSRVVSISAPDVTVIISVPNVAHHSVALPLILHGSFKYCDAGGILDSTHLRFFVRESAFELMTRAGLRVEAAVRSGFEGPRTRLVNRLTLGRMRDMLTKQYILAGRREGAQAAKRGVAWTDWAPGRRKAGLAPTGKRASEPASAAE
ncbi:MAG: class I SAM-dependent methyltransferase [Caulobacteraceae bacterium]